MRKNIAVIPGDGIGPEVTAEAIKVLDAVAGVYGHEFVYHYGLMGAVAIDQTGDPLPEETLDTCKAADAVLFGAIGDPKYDNNPDARVRPEQGLLKLRKSLELFANIRPVAVYPSLKQFSPLKEERLEGVDFIIFRELTGGIYFGEKKTDGNYASDSCTYSIEEINRITRLAFHYALKRKKHLTLVDKANVLETSRLWRKVVKDIALQYPNVLVDYLYVDNASMQIITNPGQFDIVLTENMFGDILSDEASVITGSIGLLPSASIGTSSALFEPIHGSYPQAAGMNIANPLGAILSAAMMLDHFSLKHEANLVREAVNDSLNKGLVTKDLSLTKDYCSTSEVGNTIVQFINTKISANKKQAVA